MKGHLSEDQICSALAGQATIDEQRHVHECAACRAELEGARGVLVAFRHALIATADREAQRSTPVFDRPASRARWEWALAGTVVVAVTAALISQAPRAPRTQATAGASLAQPVAVESDFFPLAYSNVPVTGGHVVRLEVPSSSLAAFGLDPADAVSPRPGAVLADIVVGEDGLARAVRFVRPPGDASPEKEKQP